MCRWYVVLVLMWGGVGLGQEEMERKEQPEETGLVRVEEGVDYDGPGEEVGRFVSEPVAVGSYRPYAIECLWRSTVQVRGVFSCEGGGLRFGLSTPLWFPDTEGEWVRVTFFARTSAGATSATVGVGVPKGEAAAMAEFSVRAVTEEEFTEVWKEWRAGYPERDLAARAGDGAHLALFVDKLTNPREPERPLLVYGIGSSYTNMLGNGERLVQWIRENFPGAPPVIYKKHVGSAVNYDFTRGWMRQLVLGERPDLVILYSGGEAEDLDKLLADFRARSTADVMVASLHLREQDKEITEATVSAPEWDEIREVALKHGCEWVDSRREWAAYLEAEGKPIEWLLKDAVHQSDHGALVINENMARHVVVNDEAAYAPAERERLVTRAGGGVEGEAMRVEADGTIGVRFRGNRVDVVGRRVPGGGMARVEIDGIAGDEVGAFLTTVIVPGAKNHRPERGMAADRAPHLALVGEGVVPQRWTIRMTSDTGDYEVEGSVTGLDGTGNNGEDFVSESGQVEIPTALWRRRLEGDGTYSNRTGDEFTWTVYRSSVGEVSFGGEAGLFRNVLAENLENGWHELLLIPEGEVDLVGFWVFEPPLHQ